MRQLLFHLLFSLFFATIGASHKIDRQALVTRHNPHRTSSNLTSPLQIGNGRFAFGTDITGLQTFVPFATMSEWGWKNDSLPAGQTPADFKGVAWETQGREVFYDIPDPEQPALSQWMIANSNRMNLGRIGLWFGSENVTESDLEGTGQELDLWTGTVRSSFEWKGENTSVETRVSSEEDAVGVKIQSDLVRNGKLSVFINFPYNNGSQKFQAPYCGIWNMPSAHSTTIIDSDGTSALVKHELDGTVYYAQLSWNGEGKLKNIYDHRYVLELSNYSESILEFTANFASNPPSPLSVEDIKNSSEDHWQNFWQEGGIIDLSESTDPRWFELERRIILSIYVHAVNEAGTWPPQESGLVNLGWYGKFHMEMTVWHLGWLALFNRWNLLYPILSVYERFLETSKERAKKQGFKGARWPKMTDETGRGAPGEINALLIWEQPHVMWWAELDWRAHPSEETAERWREVLFETAEFMVSYATLNKSTGFYDLGPPLHVMSENTDPHTTTNPAFELQYWRFGLEIAIKWLSRLGLQANTEWQQVLDNLAPIPIQDGLYVEFEGVQNMWEKYNTDHPSLSALLGYLPSIPSSPLNTTILNSTTHQIWDTWQWNSTWGWDFGLLAMNAVRLGYKEEALELLLGGTLGKGGGDGLVIDDVGLGGGGEKVPSPYFPGTGGLLLAVSMMVGGWEGSEGEIPGFPDDGGWVVRSDGMGKYL